MYLEPDEDLGKAFKKAEKELKQVAEKYGFSLRLIDDSKGTWYFYPEVTEEQEEKTKQQF